MCKRCKHRGYYTRDDAKTVKKQHHGAKGMAVFSCPHTDGMFHVGHRPEALSAGIIDRDVLRDQAQRVDVHPNYSGKGSVSSASASASITFVCGVIRARGGTPGVDSVNTLRSQKIFVHNHFRFLHTSVGRSGPT